MLDRISKEIAHRKNYLRHITLSSIISLLLIGANAQVCAHGLKYERRSDMPTILREDNMAQFIENYRADRRPFHILLFMYNEHYGLHSGAYGDTAKYFDYDNMPERECERLLFGTYPEALLDVAKLNITEETYWPKLYKCESIGLLHDNILNTCFFGLFNSSLGGQLRFLSYAFLNFDFSRPLLLHMISSEAKLEQYLCDIFKQSFKSDDILRALCLDSIDELRFLYNESETALNAFPAIEYSARVQIDRIPLTDLSIAALSKSKNCFKWLLANGRKITEFDLLCSMIGGDPEIVRLCNNNIKKLELDELNTAAILGTTDYSILKFAVENGIVCLTNSAAEKASSVLNFIALAKMVAFGFKIGNSNGLIEAGYSLCVAKYLINDGADVNYNNGAESIIHNAVHIAERLDLVTELLNNGCNANIKTNGEITPLMSALKGEMVDLLIKYTSNLNINATNTLGQTALHRACSIGSLETINALISHMSDVNKRDDAGKTPLMTAIKTSNPYRRNDIIKAILRNGGRLSINQADVRGETAIHYAVSTDNVELVALLIENGADVNASNYLGRTPLMNARSVEMARLLLQNGAALSINVSTNSMDTAILLAVSTGNVEWVALLIENGADVNALNHAKKTQLQMASSIEMAELLLANGASLTINHANYDGETALFTAVKNNDIRLVELLIYYMADVNKKDALGSYPLQMASSVEMAELLLKSGAILTINQFGNTYSGSDAKLVEWFKKSRATLDNN